MQAPVYIFVKPILDTGLLKLIYPRLQQVDAITAPYITIIFVVEDKDAQLDCVKGARRLKL